MAGHHDLDTHFGGALHYRLEVLNFKPKEHTIAIGPIGAIGDGAVMVLDLEAV